jgi:ribA/ribD-fused uncharacterized protein
MTIEFFGPKRSYGFLSNFYEAVFTLEDRQWLTVEHFFQASKAVSPEERQRIADAATPGLAKKLGRACQLRPDWDDVVGTEHLHNMFRDEKGIVVEFVKDHYMYSALISKFTQRHDLREALRSTGDQAIVEASPTDYYWGIGKERTGLNKLGRMLQLVRAGLPREEDGSQSDTEESGSD